MAHRIAEIKGLSDKARTDLVGHGIHTVEQLLAETATPSQKNALAKTLSVQGSELTEWINRADLMRLNGVGTEYANLLEDCGVDSCKELQHRVPEHLLAKLKEINDEKHIVHQLPSVNQLETWIAEAKTISATG